MRKALLVLGLLAVFSLSAKASIVLTFEGLKNSEPVNNFYNGGFGGDGSGPGPNFGVSWSNAQAFIEDEAGGLQRRGFRPPLPPLSS